MSLIALVATACSGTELPTDEVFQGSWIASSVTAPDGPPIDLPGASIVVEIDTNALAVSAQTPCALVLGSYTLEREPNASAGRAGFTLPGTGQVSCEADDRSRHDAFITAAEAVDEWKLVDDTIEFSSSSTSARLVLSPLG